MARVSFSVVIPLYNKEGCIARTLNSAIAQTVQDFEIIVVDDGSTDGGAKIVQDFKDPRIHLIQQKNAGVSAARNRGIAEAKGNLIAFLDADDEWMPTFLETIKHLYNRYPMAGAFATAYRYRMNGWYEHPKYKNLPEFPWEGILNNYFRSALGDPPVCTSAVAVKGSVLNEVGGFPESEQLAEDLDTWIRIALKYPIAWSSSVEAVYNRDVVNSLCKEHKLAKDFKLIDTIKNALLQISDSRRYDVLNLIGKYYMICSRTYFQCGDIKNAIRCINESIKYSRGSRIITPTIYRLTLSLPDPIRRKIITAKSAFNRIFRKFLINRMIGKHE